MANINGTALTEEQPTIVSLQHEWPFEVSYRDDYGMMREAGFLSLALACDFAKYMDARPLELGARDVVLFIRGQEKRFIPVGDGFHTYEPLARRAVGGGE